MVLGSSKEARTALFSNFTSSYSIFTVSYFTVDVSCKPAFEEGTCQIIVNKFVGVSLSIEPLMHNVRKGSDIF